MFLYDLVTLNDRVKSSQGQLFPYGRWSKPTGSMKLSNGVPEDDEERLDPLRLPPGSSKLLGPPPWEGGRRQLPLGRRQFGFSLGNSEKYGGETVDECQNWYSH